MRTTAESSNAETQTLIDALASFASDLNLSEVPAEVKRQAGLCVLDTIGCMLAGAESPDGMALLAAERALDGAHGVARILGTGQLLSAEATARVHGYWGDIFELNDLIGGHASIGNVAAALALVERRESSGASLLKAVIAGIEITSRIYSSVYPTLKPYTDVSMVTPGVVSAFGAAAVAASLHGISRAATREALAMAGTLTTWCPAEAIFGDGGTIKPMLFGALPASIGLRATAYAQQGLTGPRHLLESPIGLLAMLGRNPDLNVLRNPQRWFLAEPRRKLHACCGYTHAAIDLAVDLRKQLGADVLAGSRLQIGMPAYVIPAVSKSRPPRTANEARFHLEYCVALAACGSNVILPHHSMDLDAYLERDEIRHMLANIEVVTDSSLTHYHQTHITVLRNGQVVAQQSLAGPRGSPQNPMSDAEVIEKFQRLSAHRLDRDTAAAYAARFLTLDIETDCRWIFDTLLPSGT